MKGETAEDETTEAASIISEAREHLTVELCRLQLGRLELLNFGAIELSKLVNDSSFNSIFVYTVCSFITFGETLYSDESPRSHILFTLTQRRRGDDLDPFLSGSKNGNNNAR